MLSIKNLSKKYGKNEVLRDLSLDFSSGVYALLGPNGAGKSTLLNIVSQVIRFDSGLIFYDNQDIKNNKKFLNELAYLPQSPAFYPNYTGYEMLEYLGCLKGMKIAELKETIPVLLDAVNLNDVHKKKIAAYSGGMRQRLGIAQSLLGNPKILILDEPLNGLDPKERMRFRNLIASLSKDKIIIIATHIVSDVMSIADEVLLFNDGKVIQRGNVEELCNKISGQVYDLVVDDDQDLKGLNISNLNYKNGLYYARVIGDSNEVHTPSKNITLEDVYLYHFGADYEVNHP